MSDSSIRFLDENFIEKPNIEIMKGDKLAQSLTRNEIEYSQVVSVKQVKELYRININKANAVMIFGSHYISATIYDAFGISFDLESI